MSVNYNGYDYTADRSIDFLMLTGCYMNGCNCYNCHERILGSCVIDELDEDDIQNIYDLSEGVDNVTGTD